MKYIKKYKHMDKLEFLEDCLQEIFDKYHILEFEYDDYFVNTSPADKSYIIHQRFGFDNDDYSHHQNFYYLDKERNCIVINFGFGEKYKYNDDILLENIINDIEKIRNNIINRLGEKVIITSNLKQVGYYLSNSNKWIEISIS